MKAQELFWLLNNDRDWIAYYEGLDFAFTNKPLRRAFASFPDKTGVIAANANWTPVIGVTLDSERVIFQKVKFN